MLHSQLQVFKICLEYWNFFVPDVYSSVCTIEPASQAAVAAVSGNSLDRVEGVWVVCLTLRGRARLAGGGELQLVERWQFRLRLPACTKGPGWRRQCLQHHVALNFSPSWPCPPARIPTHPQPFPPCLPITSFHLAARRRQRPAAQAWRARRCMPRRSPSCGRS